MTLKVKVTHDQPGYPHNVLVTPVNPTTGAPNGEAVVLKDGESCEKYVHGGQQLVITEVLPS